MSCYRTTKQSLVGLHRYQDDPRVKSAKCYSFDEFWPHLTIGLSTMLHKNCCFVQCMSYCFVCIANLLHHTCTLRILGDELLMRGIDRESPYTYVA